VPTIESEEQKPKEEQKQKKSEQQKPEKNTYIINL
jgi:hypothetical protein